MTAHRRRQMLGMILSVSLLAGAQQKTGGKPGAATSKKTSSVGIPADWRQIRKPPLPPFKPQLPRRVELENGMVLFLQEDHELPMIDGHIRIRGGSREADPAKSGMMSVYGGAWRTGGTRSRTGDQLDDFLEARAARVETGGGIDSTSMSWSCLKGDFDDVVKVVAELLREPEFRDDKVTLAKQQISTSISRRNDEIGEITSRESTRLAYGRDNPYARVPEYFTVARVQRQDLLDWHKRTVHPNNMLLGVVGDFDSAAMETKLRQVFGGWQRGPVFQKAETQFPETKPGVYFVEKEDVNQTSISMVHLGIKRDNPDYYALVVMNEIFGGGFSSRLFARIRTREGLAYSVGGGVGTAFDHPGIFEISMGTKTGSTAKAIDSLYSELDNLAKTPPSPVEMARAKDTILNSFIFHFDSKDKIMNERITYEFYGYPADFLERFRSGIEKVSAADVERVAKQYVHRDKLALLVVGKSADFDRPLSTFGKVQNIDITIPDKEPSGNSTATGGNAEAATAKPASNSEGKLLAEKMAKAFAAPQDLAAIKTLRAKALQVLKTPQGEIPLDVETVVVYPDQVYRKMGTPQGDMLMVVTPQNAFMAREGESQDLPSAMKNDLRNTMRRDPLYVAMHVNDPSYSFRAAGEEMIGETKATVLLVDSGGAEAKFYVDPQSGRVLRTVARSAGMGPPADESVDFSDWRAEKGINLPHKRMVRRDGQDAGSSETKQVEINPAVDSKIFQKPGPPQ